MHCPTTKPLAFALATILALSSSSALGAFFGLFENSVSNMGVAHAGGSAIAEDTTTVWYNPAGMTRLEGHQFSVGGHLIFPSTKFENQGSTLNPALGLPPVSLPQPIPLSGGDGGDAGKDALVPHFYYTRPINDRVTFGLAVNVPFGLETDYDDGWVGRYHALNSEIQTLNINPSVAYKINDKFSIGGGISVQHVEATLTSAVDFGTICLLGEVGGAIPAGACRAPLGIGFGLTGPQGNDGRSTLEADDTNLGANFGFLWEVSDATRVGFHYRSAFRHDLEGDQDVDTVDPAATAFAPAAGIVDSDIEAEITFPASISVSAYHQLNLQWAIMGDVTQVRWGRLPELRVKFDSGQPDTVITLNLDDTERYAFGAVYTRDSRWTYRFGIAFDDTPTPNASDRTPRLPDADRIWYTFGFNYKKDERMSIDFAYAFLDIDEAKIAKSTTDPENAFRGNLVGEYDADVSILSAQVNWKFQTR